jgi:DNA-binding transcriptional ArsR family regulator
MEPDNKTVFATRFVDIEADGFVDISVDWDTTGKIGLNHVTAHADPLNEIKEVHEDDNNLTIDLRVGTAADLTVSTDVPTYERGQEVSILVFNSKGTVLTGLEVLYPDGTVLLVQDVMPDLTGIAYQVIELELDYPIGTYVINVTYNSTINSTSFEVVNEPPTISSPPDLTYLEGTTGNLIEWECWDRTPTTRNVIIDGLVLLYKWNGSDVQLNVDGYSPGVHNITLELLDLSGNRANDTVVVTVEPLIINEPPEVSITSPMSGAKVRGLITITGTAMDPDDNLASVEIMVGNGDAVKADGTNDWSFDMDTWSYPNGTYTILVRAVDEEGLASTDSITLTIENIMVSYKTTPDKGITTPVSVTVMSLTLVAALGVGLATTDIGRWGLFKLLFLAGYAKRKDEKVLDNFLRGIILGVIIRDPGVRPIDVADGIEGGYANSLIYYHIHELIKFGYINMVQRNRKGKIVKSWKGTDGKMNVRDGADKGLSETELTMRASNLEGMSLHLYPSGMVAPESQVSIRRKQRFMVYKYIAENPGMSLKEIAEGLDMVRQGVSYHLKELKKDGLLIIGSQGRRRYYYIDKGKAVDLRGDVSKAPIPTPDEALKAARDGR